MFSNLKGWEWLIIVALILLLFGAKRLPDAARGLGRSMRIFKAETKGLTGNVTELSLEHAGITCNKNGIPFDPQPPTVTSGVRLGTPAGTTRGFGNDEFVKIGHLIGDVLDGLAQNAEDNKAVEARVREEVRALCRAFPIYQ